MNAPERIGLFSKELGYISSPQCRRFAEFCLTQLPEYFFHVPASSTGKYHPNYALGEGGLVRHTKAACGIACELNRAGIDEWYLFDSESGTLIDHVQFDDEIYCALLLHDGLKMGDGCPKGCAPTPLHTVHEHPLLMRDALLKWSAQYGYDMPSAMRIASCISTHMGKWCFSPYSSVMLPTPDCSSWQAKICHLCDYLASRKCLEYRACE